MLVETNGWLLHQVVQEASLPDHTGGKDLRTPLQGRFPQLKLIWAESGDHQGGLVEWVKATGGWEVEIVAHPWSGFRGVWVPEGGDVDGAQIRPKGFPVLTWRGMVERTFAWLSTWRRLAKDDELLPSGEEAGISLAMIRLMLRRLAQNRS